MYNTQQSHPLPFFLHIHSCKYHHLNVIHHPSCPSHPHKYACMKWKGKECHVIYCVCVCCGGSRCEGRKGGVCREGVKECWWDTSHIHFYSLIHCTGMC